MAFQSKKAVQASISEVANAPQAGVPPCSNMGGKFRQPFVGKPSPASVSGHSGEREIPSSGYELSIDWCAFTFVPPDETLQTNGFSFLEHAFGFLREVLDLPTRLRKLPPEGFDGEDLPWGGKAEWAEWHEPILDFAPRKAAGMAGFKEARDLCTTDELGAQIKLGVVAWGGSTQSDRVWVSITGRGCDFLRPKELCRWLEQADRARLTRVDIALDDYAGLLSVDRAVKMYKTGVFNTKGMTPSSDTAGDWIGKKKGRTLYVGNRKNGKLCRVYEKGLEQKIEGCPWVRWEIELGSKDRVLPFDLLTEPAKYFKGAYSGFEKVFGPVLPEAAERIRTRQKKEVATVLHSIKWARHAYGKLVGMLGDAFGPEEALKLLTKPGWFDRLGGCLSEENRVQILKKREPHDA